jgi:hypothetical protein
MKVNLSINEDEELRKQVRELIHGQVRAILREELSGIVATEMAKIKLLQPDSTDLQTMITKQLDNAIKRKITSFELNKLVREQLDMIISKDIAVIKQNIQQRISSELMNVLTKS